jgi:hypothetical protein
MSDDGPSAPIVPLRFSRVHCEGYRRAVKTKNCLSWS